MATQTDTIKEFLVALGFKVDEGQYKRFNNAITGATKLTEGLGAIVGAVVLGTTAVVSKVAEAMEKLYYVSQRTGSSIASIKGFDYAIANLGGSAEGAESSLESLGHFIRSYPGSDQFLEKLGVDPKHVKDSQKAMLDLGTTFRNMPFWQAQAYANVLGIDEKTLLALQSGEYGKYLEDYNRRIAEVGVNSQRAGERGQEFMVALRGVSAEASIAGQALEDRFAPSLVKVLHLMDDFFKGAALLASNPDQWTKNFNNATGDVFDARRLTTRTPGHVLPDWFYTKKQTEGAAGAPGGASDTRSQEEKRKFLNDYFISQGWSAQAAAGITDRLGVESKFDPTAVGDHGQAYGLFQAHKEWRNEFKKVMGKDIFGSSLEEQAKFVNYALTQSGDRDARAAGTALKSASTEQQAYAAFTNGFEKPAVPVGGGASITQNNTYNISGASDPNAVASGVAAKQDSANKQLIRNIGGAVQ